MTTLTQDQLDAIYDAGDEDLELGELPDLEVAKRLAAAGHPLFEGFGAEEPKATLSGRAKDAKPVRKRRKRAAEPATDAPANGVPALDTGTPVTASVVEDGHKPSEQGQAAAPPPDQSTALAVAPQQHHAVATVAQGVGVEGMEDIDTSDLMIPSLQLKQAQTKDEHKTGISEVKDGDWFLTTDPQGAVEFREEIGDDGDVYRELVFLEIKKGRQFMLEYDEDDRAEQLERLGLADVVPDDTKVICRSLDFKVPVVREDADWPPFSPTCATCPKAQWTTGAGGKRRKPACGLTYRALVVDRTDGTDTPARVFFKSSGIRPVRSLLTRLAIAAKRHGGKIWALSVPTSSKLVEGRKGKFYAPQFGRPLPVEDPEAVAMFGAVRAGLVADGHQDEGEE